MNILVTFILFVVLRPKPIVLFWCLVCIGYWHVTLFSQPQSNPPPLDVAFGTFLPVLFIAYGFWRVAFRFTLPALSELPLESAVWYLATFWAGVSLFLLFVSYVLTDRYLKVLANITLDKIPIQTLTASSLQKEGGAVAALIIIVIVVAVIVINQVGPEILDDQLASNPSLILIIGQDNTKDGLPSVLSRMAYCRGSGSCGACLPAWISFQATSLYHRDGFDARDRLSN